MRTIRSESVLVCQIASALIGGVGLWLLRDLARFYHFLFLPILAPPLWLAVVFSFAFFLLLGSGFGIALSIRQPLNERNVLLRLWGAILALYLAQVFVVFYFEFYRITFIMAMVTFILCFCAASACARVNRTAGKVLFPCILWAGYLAYMALYLT